MKPHTDIVSKVLVLDDDQIDRDSLRAFCEAANLSGVRPPRTGASAVMGVLGSNVDLGGILIGERYLGSPARTFELVADIRAQRPELPIFLRRDSADVLDDLPGKTASMFRQAYTLGAMDRLQAGLESHIFSRVYPNELARGVREISLAAMESLFTRFNVDAEAPYLVFDRIIPGEVFTLIGIESNWCRGYMSFQGSEQTLNGLILAEYPDVPSSFREINQYLGELTNLVWGGFKNRFVDSVDSPSKTQVPIIVNTAQGFISFGSEDPQLCFKYRLTPKDAGEEGAPSQEYLLYQRFVFNLNWSPEDFRQVMSVDALMASGDLELF